MMPLSKIPNLFVASFGLRSDGLIGRLTAGLTIRQDCRIGLLRSESPKGPGQEPRISRTPRSWGFLRAAISLLLCLLLSSFASAAEQKIHVWHQMLYSYRVVLVEAARRFEAENPGVKVVLTYRETEELRSSFQAAALGGSGPELIYGPSDQVGPLATMGLIAPLEGQLSESELADFDPAARVTFKGSLYALGDVVGNHLMLLYNKKLLPAPPATTDEMIRLGRELTRDTDGDGRVDQYGLTWNYTEPFFFVPWIAGFGGKFFDDARGPDLDTPAVREAFAFIRGLRDTHKIVPKESDYETANALFKDGKAAMLVNGDWSWGDYKAAKVDFGIAPLPKVSSTGLWPSPLVSTKAYSLNINLREEQRDLALKLLRHLTGPETQRLFADKVSALPSRLTVRKLPAVASDPLLSASATILAKGSPMPIVPEIRAVWDSLRGPYQSLLGGSVTPLEAARQAQEKSLAQIRAMNEVIRPGAQALPVKALLGLAALAGLYFVFRAGRRILIGLRGRDRVPYIFLLPGMLAIFAVILFPFLYNVAISLSNFSLQTFRQWEIVGFQHYLAVLSDPVVYAVLGKTVLWTLLNVFFHVTIGIALALLLDQALPARPLFRTLLIVPWAVPQYITALSWRSFFHQEYGPINLALERFLHLSPVQWLSRPWEAFSACVLTNVWLGFPFMMVVALGGLQAIPKTLYEAARVDGASAFQRFRVITLPLLMPVMFPAAVLGAVWTFNNLNVIWLVSNGGEPADQTHILVSYVYKAAFSQYRYAYGAALSLLIFLLLAGATLYSVSRAKADKGAY
jgi:arabinogalactan oligomer / maltooligosaccharide transport system permease protein